MQSHFPTFPHLYDAPADVTRLLRDVEPCAELLYFGWGEWALMRLAPDSRRRQAAAKALWGHTEKDGTHTPGAIGRLERWYQIERHRAVGRAAFKRSLQRYLHWQAIYLGARPIAHYSAAEVRSHGLEYIVEDYRRMRYLMAQSAHIADEHGLDRLFNGAKDDAIQASRADLRDESKALYMAGQLARRPVSITSSAPAGAGRSSVLIPSVQ